MLHLTGLCEITGTHDKTLMLASGTATGWLVGGVSVTIPHPSLAIALMPTIVPDLDTRRSSQGDHGQVQPGALCKFGILEGCFVVTQLSSGGARSEAEGDSPNSVRYSTEKRPSSQKP
jgi:hypothetical protein